jgi:O-antigen/teichoic acid export membrane protein
MAFTRTALSVLATQTVILPITLLTSILLARLLSVHDRGLYAVATELAGVAVIVVQLGWPAASIYQLRRLGSMPSSVAAAAVYTCLIVSAAAIGLCLAFEPSILERFFSAADPPIFYVALAIIPFQMLGLFSTGIARGIDRFDLHNAYRFSLAALTLTAITATLILYQRSAMAALSAFLSAHATVSIVLLVIILRSSGFQFRISATEVRTTLRFGAKTHGQNILFHVHQHIGIFMIAYFLDDPAQVGLYAVAVGIANQTRLFPGSITIAMFPTVAGLGPVEASRFVARICRNAIFWMTLMVVLLAPTSPFLVPLLFSDRYTDSVGPLLILLPAVPVLTVYLVLARYFTARNRQQVNIVIQTISTISNIALNVWWIPMHGIVGAAAASLCSYLLQSVLILSVFVKESGQKARAALVIGKDDWLTYQQRILTWRSQFRGRS